MNKALILLILVAVIAAQITLTSSFYTVSDYSSTSNTSALVVAKANYLSVRVKFTVYTNPGSTALLLFSDGSQKIVTSSYSFEVLLARNGSSFGSFAASTPAGIISDRDPINVAVLSNVTGNFIANEITSRQDTLVTFFWFEIQGQAQVYASTYGVAI
jgi:hypothetical protein